VREGRVDASESIAATTTAITTAITTAKPRKRGSTPAAPPP